MRNRNLTNWFCLSGVIALVFYILHDVVGAMHYPNYDWMSQAVSDLTAVNAPSWGGYGYLGITKSVCGQRV